MKGRGPRFLTFTPTLTLPRRGGGCIEGIPSILGYGFSGGNSLE